MSPEDVDPSFFSEGEVDADIAALLSNSGPPGPSRSNSPAPPSFDDIFEPKKKGENAPVAGSREGVDLSRTGFAPVQRFTEPPKPYFADKNYYRNILSNEGETATRFHKLFSDFLNATENEVRSQARLRVIPAYWELIQVLVRTLSPRMEEPKRLAIRYGALLPSLITPEQRNFIASIIYDNKIGEPIHFMDEWLRKVGMGEVTPLATDEEVRATKKGNDTSVWSAKLEKAEGQYQAQANLCRIKMGEMRELEANMSQWLVQISRHGKHPTFEGLEDGYDNQQRSSLFQIQEGVKKLNNMDKELSIYFRDLEKIHHEVQVFKEKLAEAGGEGVVDTKVVINELNSVRQMIKMSCGRQGNHFPILMKNYMPHRIEDIASRENVLHIMASVERLDPGLFMRSFKGSFNRIPPHVILLPCYGEFGLCWEPFEKYNRSTSRGRIGIPMYPKNLRMAVIYALADLRWQVAKEKAGYHWMEEGITGWYYQWFSERGMKGDVRLFFIQDYILWITKEAEGTQKLDKEVRGIFWRNMPFPQDVRDMLKNRGFVYSELYKKDINRAMSDGY